MPERLVTRESHPGEKCANTSPGSIQVLRIVVPRPTRRTRSAHAPDPERPRSPFGSRLQPRHSSRVARLVPSSAGRSAAQLLPGLVFRAACHIGRSYPVPPMETETAMKRPFITVLTAAAGAVVLIGL